MAKPSRTGWTVTKASGQQYGPIDLDTLLAWAADGRLEPEDRVADRRADRPAPEWDFLHMEWMVRRPDGTRYGPTTAGAVRAMLLEGELTLDAPIRNARTGETGTLGHHPLFHPPGMVRADQVRVPVGPQDVLEPSEPPPAEALAAPPGPLRWQPADDAPPASAAASDRPMLDPAAGPPPVPLPEIEEEALPLADRRELEDQLHRAEAKLAQWKEFARQYFLVGDREHHEPNRAELDELARQLITRSESLADLQAVLDHLQPQLQQRVLENDRLIQERESIHRFYRLQLERLYQELSREQARTRRVAGQTARAQRAYDELLARYRELHRQLIDLQDELRKLRTQPG